MAAPSNHLERPASSATTSGQQRFGGILWQLARRTSGITRPLAGKGWNPIFAVVLHRGRTSGRWYETPVAARRFNDGFVISLAFGAQVDWYQNLLASRGGLIRWRGREYPVTAPERVDVSTGLAAFHPIQRGALRICGIDGFVRLPDAAAVR